MTYPLETDLDSIPASKEEVQNVLADLSHFECPRGHTNCGFEVLGKSSQFDGEVFECHCEPVSNSAHSFFIEFTEDGGSISIFFAN